MGRPYTGADYTTSALRLDIRHLVRWGLIAKGRTAHTSITYTDGAEVKLEARDTGESRRTLSITFRLRDYSGSLETWNQEVELQALPSNLGKGEVLYFYCSRSGKRCRILYRAYHSKGFYHREAFRYRLYYPLQVIGKLERANTQYFATEKRLDRLHTKRKQSTYKGLPTQRETKKEQLYEQLEELDNLRWSPQCMPKRLRGLLMGLSNY
jgi:hypothetical protein